MVNLQGLVLKDFRSFFASFFLSFLSSWHISCSFIWSAYSNKYGFQKITAEAKFEVNVIIPEVQRMETVVFTRSAEQYTDHYDSVNPIKVTAQRQNSVYLMFNRRAIQNIQFFFISTNAFWLISGVGVLGLFCHKRLCLLFILHRKRMFVQ